MPELAPWSPPDALALPLVELVQRAEREALAVLTPALRADSVAAALDAWPQIRATLERWLGNRLVHDVVTSAGERARRAADEHWREQLSTAVGRDVVVDTQPSRELLAAWIATNTARIQGLRNESLERLRADLETAALSQVNPQTLAAQWEREGLPTVNGRLRGRALVIATDQLCTLAGQIAEAQQRALGLTEYMWDDRPSIPRQHRRVHAGRRGARYRWDAPPPDGHPGAAILCRCRAVAVVGNDRLRDLGGR